MAGRKIFTITDSFTRPDNTTQYADGDLVANSTTAGSVVPLHFAIGDPGAHIVRIYLTKSDTGITAASFDVRFFAGTSPTVANGDGDTMSHDFANHIATIDMGTMVAGTDVAYAFKNIGESSGVYYSGWLNACHSDIYALIEADGTYTPTAEEIFTLGVTIEQID